MSVEVVKLISSDVCGTAMLSSNAKRINVLVCMQFPFCPDDMLPEYYIILYYLRKFII